VELFFVRRRLAGQWSVPGGPSGAAVRDILDHRALPEGLPVLLDARMRPVEPICSWFRHLAYALLEPETLRCYAYIARRLVAFLAERGCDVLSAIEADLIAYRAARTEHQRQPVDDATWRREAAVLNALFSWLLEQGRLRRLPFRVPRRGSPLGGAARKEMQIRHLTLPQYRYWRDVGMGGQRCDAAVDPGFRGWAPHRHRAAVELALLTGMRKQEWSTLLLPELGEGWRRPADPVDLVLQACAKYQRRRVVYVPVAALRMLDVYLLLERPDLVRRSAQALAARRADLFVVDTIDHETGRVRGVLDGQRRSFAVEAMSPSLRRIAVRETDGGLEALAVFVGHGGLMLGPSSWDRIRLDAWRRMRRHAADDPRAPVLPSRPWRFHDLRHSFCLQLLKYLMRVMIARESEQQRGLPSLAEHVAFNPLLVVQRRMGHASPSTTYLYLRYLEDPLNYVDEAFRQWVEHDDASYADIAARALEAGNASQG